jgi:FixJ family two-component response regulator
MPEMKGPELRQRVLALRPTLEVIFMSGHAPSLVVGPTPPDDEVRFLKKPFTLAELASSVASALRPGRPAPP